MPLISGYTRSADTYVHGRPDYPATIVPWLTNTLGVDESVSVVDLGAGTGKFTRYLLQTGARVIAVEPVAALPATQQAQVRARILALIDRTPILKNHDQVTFPYETLAYCIKRQ